VAVGHYDDFFQTPNMVGQATSHCRGDSQCLVDSGEIVVRSMNRNHRRIILNLLAETIGRSGKRLIPIRVVKL
jgi:hypothetical protein